MQAKKYSIKKLPKDDRPREKLLRKSPAALTDSELLAILINHGTPERNALELAREVLALGNNSLIKLGKLTVKEIMSIRGMGFAKAAHIAAALELGKRRHAASFIRKKVKSSKEVAEYIRTHIQDYKHEVFGVLYLNQANRIANFSILSHGGITATVADPRLILKKALELDAVSLILCHNHPSGNLKPSQADIALTTKVREAAGYLDIRLVDHIIVSEEGYFSLADEGLV